MLQAPPLTNVGIRLPNSGPFAEAANILRIARRAEDLGFGRVWVHDHLSWPDEKLTHFALGSIEACSGQDPNFFESIATCAFLLGRLERIHVGIAGLVMPLRDPRVLAKQLAALDHLAGSRLLVACAIGAVVDDFEAMDVPFNRRGRLTNEYLAALREALFGGRSAFFSGDTLNFGGTFLPSARNVPLWITGSSEPGLRRVLKYGDGWLTVYQSPDSYSDLVDQLNSLAQEVARDVTTLARGYETYVCVGPTMEEAIQSATNSLQSKFESIERGLDVCMIGTAIDVVDKMSQYRERGVTEFEVKLIAHDLEQAEWMMSEISQALDS